MAVLEFDGRKTVGAFIERLEGLFEGKWKVYEDRNARHVADERDKMASVQVFRARTTGTLTFRSDMYLGNLYELIEEQYGYVVRAFRPDGRVQLNENFRLKDIEKVPYQASKDDMRKLAEDLARNIEKENLTKVADEIAEKGRNVKDRKRKEEIDKAVEILDELEESKGKRDYYVIVQEIIEKYGIKEVLMLISAILKGDIITVGITTATVLNKIYVLLKDYLKQ